jgi:EEF1A N-terminal glycine/lysine methyltransferase
MPPLTDLIRIVPPDRDEEPEDIFASAPGLIFTDDLRNQHGDPGSIIIYKSGRFGEIELRTADPEGEDERQLFSHYLWNAGIKLAELISGEGDEKWQVDGQTVLELGAGALG